jgi:unsaturated rhamnogalacturonyl hydrolase
MNKIGILIILISFLSNSSFSKTKWSQRFADAVIARYDSLVNYNGNKPKYEYDYAFLGTAIYFVDDKGNISGHKLTDYNIDRIRPGFDILELYSQTKEQKYMKAIETLVSQMETHPRTYSKGFWHKKIYPYQMWLDGLYMAQPFLARYARDFNQPEWFGEVVFQINECYKNTVDPKTGLVFHAWDESRQQRWCTPETGQSKHCWSRGTGWYLMAVVDVLDFLPENHEGRQSLIDILNKLSSALLKFRDPKTGLWYQVIEQGNRPGNYLEASGSAMIVYAWAKGANKRYLSKSYKKAALKSFNGLINNLVIIDKDGYPTLKNVCGGCGLGGSPYREADYHYYITEKIVANDQKGVAPLILAALELGK